MRGLTARTENPQTPKQASDHPSDHLMDFRAVTRCHRESAISMCPRFLNAMTRDVPSERLPKLDVAGRIRSATPIIVGPEMAPHINRQLRRGGELLFRLAGGVREAAVHDLVEERLVADLQQARGLGPVPVDALEHLLDGQTLAGAPGAGTVVVVPPTRLATISWGTCSALPSTAIRFRVFSSSRTFPGHEYSVNARSVVAGRSGVEPYSFLNRVIRWPTSAGISSQRSRSGGTRTSMTLSR